MPKNNENKVAKVVFCRYIIRNGKRIYPKNATVFRFIVYEDEE